ncbi:YaiI/YqxD family protein [Vibrio gallicus]|uniref:YaiI/YqxD family protein n=1 Tax=Vibrio gallicus TaxID=190897 RepID=UPI0021C40779|nr:YaiI/YqxD family protein [Vibrio gallicus]
MKILVDADSCPKVIRDVLIRASERTGIECVFVANHPIPLPQRNNIRQLRVNQGFDVADNVIVELAEAGDLVITSDIPLADEVLTKQAKALSSRGEEFTEQNIKARLNIRDFMDTMRTSGVQTSGPSALSQTDRREFANALDRILAKTR